MFIIYFEFPIFRYYCKTVTANLLVFIKYPVSSFNNCISNPVSLKTYIDQVFKNRNCTRNMKSRSVQLLVDKNQVASSVVWIEYGVMI